jgi:hypothetical protein
MTDPENADSVFSTAEEDAGAAILVEDTPQTRSDSYRLAYTDRDFLLCDEFHPVRLRLELLKPELIMELANPEIESFYFENCKIQLGCVQTAYDDIKARLLSAGAELRIPIPQIIDVLDQNSRIRRMARQMYKGILYLGEMYSLAQMQTPQSMYTKSNDITVESQ